MTGGGSAAAGSNRASPGLVVAVRGHESPDPDTLRELCGPRVVTAGRGRELFERVSGLLTRGERLCVVPMTLGRDPELAADAARALRALNPAAPGPVTLAEPFGTATHLVGWLRAAAERVPVSAALLVTAPASDPFADAELYRVARLVRQYGERRLVEVALRGGDPDVDEGLRRCRALGAHQVALLSASFAPPSRPGPADVLDAGPLLSAAAVARVLEARVAEAWHRFEQHGQDGIAAALDAAHGHGLAHSHSHEHSHGYEHDHSHDHDAHRAAGASGARRAGPPRRPAQAFPSTAERSMA